MLINSTQFGCAVGYRMYDAGAMGFHNNLTAGEILGQVRKVLSDNPGLDPRSHPKLKVHFARMGEPALKPAVLEALRLLPSELPSAAARLPGAPKPGRRLSWSSLWDKERTLSGRRVPASPRTPLKPPAQR